MMYTESGSDVDVLHDALFQGAIARLNNLKEISAIVGFTQNFLEERLAPIQPVRIHEMEHDLGGRCAELKREYANSGRVKELWKNLFEAVGLDPQMAMRDRLTLRFQPPRPPSGERPWTRSTATVAFHRDTWGTNLYAQVNWWAPVYPITAGRTFAFLPELFGQPLKNNSSEFDIVALMERNRGRGLPVGEGEMVPQLQEQIDLSIAQSVTISPGELIVFSIITVSVFVSLASNGEAYDQILPVERAVANYRPRICRPIEAHYPIAAWLAVIDDFAAIRPFGFTGGCTGQQQESKS